MLPYPSSAFHLLPITSMFNFLQEENLKSLTRDRILQGKKQVATTTNNQLTRKKGGCLTNRRSEVDEKKPMRRM